MKRCFQYEEISEKHIEATIGLVMDAYKEERQWISYLPEEQQLIGIVRESISTLVCKGTGIVAVLEGELVGFIAGYERKELWGNNRGIYCPLYGHGAAKEHRRTIYQELYRHAAHLWVQRGITSHALTTFSHDKDTIDTWFWLGFGNRCVDAIRRVAPISTNQTNIAIKKIGLEALSELAEVESKLHTYFNHSPMFMPRQKTDPVDQLTQWLSEDNHHLWAAYRDGKVVGHMQIQPEGESFITEHPDVMNITGAYVLDSERNTGVAVLLLDAIQKWQMDNGYPLCGVDFESFNVDGSRFWNKYFTPYTYSVTRRIDERILMLSR